MIVPIIYTLNPIFDNVWYTWVFRKAVSFAINNNSVVIAQQQYFEKEDLQKKNFPKVFSGEQAENFDFDIPQKGDLEKVRKIIIPNIIESEYIKRFPSQTDAYMDTFQNGWPEMEEYLECEIEKLQKEEKIEAFMMICNVKFVENVANRLDIPILYFENGPFREPFYRNTAYLNFNGIAGDSGLEQEYCNFEREYNGNEIILFSNTEILSLFMKKWCLDYAKKDKRNPKFEVGLVIGYNVPIQTTARSMISAPEMFTEVKKYFDETDVCVRYHPGDPIHARVNSLHVDEGHLLDFLMKCRRIVCATSNLAYEAMLYDIPTYDICSWSQYAFITGNSLDKCQDKIASALFMNYVAFVHLVPFELLNDVEYLRYRLSNPSDIDLYRFHMEYYLKCLGLEKLLEGDIRKPGDYMEDIMRIRLQDEEEFKNNPEIEINNEIDRYASLCIKLNNSINEIDRLKKEISRMEHEREELKNMFDTVDLELRAVKGSMAYRCYKKIKNILRRN